MRIPFRRFTYFAAASLATIWLLASVASAEDAAITRGLDWLQAQVQANGSLSGEAGSLALTEQVRTEAAHTLAQAGRTAALPSLTPSEVSDLSTELLSRRMIAQGATGDGADAVLPFLTARANADGGFGSAVGQPSNPLDTSLALLAMRAGGLTRDSRVAAALGFLDGAANSDGSYSLGQSTYATAYALQAFVRYRNDYSLGSPIQRTRSALLAQQTGSGFGDATNNAVATIALAQSGAASDAAAAVTALRNSQSANGSWQDDPYVTAVALRALLIAGAAPSTNAGQVVGEVYDATTGLPLGQAQVALSGIPGSVLSSASNGGFTVENVPAGSYTVTISLAGYGNYSGSVQVQGGNTTNVGRISLKLADNSATLRGRVTDSKTQAALAGVTVQVTGPVTTQAQTQSDGHYELLGLPAGTYAIAFSKSGYQTLTQSADLPANTAVTFSPALTPLGEPLPTTADVKGRVVKASDGSALAGAQVQIGGQTATSAADGSFQLTGLNAGIFSGGVQATGYDSVTISGVLANGANDLGQIALSATQSQTQRTLIGTVTSSTGGAPIAGAGLTLNGVAAGTTDANGQYRIEDTGTPEVTLSFDAAGYQARTVSTRLENPGVYRLDASLDDLQEGTFQVLNLRATPFAVLPDETIRITADIANLTMAAKPALVLVRVLDADGKKVAQVCGAQTAGAPAQCEFAFESKQSIPFVADWLVPNLPAGSYTLAIHVVEPGSITRNAPLGLVLGSSSRSIQIKSVLGLQGTVVPSPPVMIPGSPKGVSFTALVQNKGNDVIPAGQARLLVTDRANGGTAFTATVALPELLPNGLAELDFGNWHPSATGAQFDLQVVDTDPTVAGAATGEFYVGDAASGEFTVTPGETGDGTQRVEATLTVKGIDNPTGQAADPLFTLVRQAVTRGGTYTGVQAQAWQDSTNCLGCHIQTQSLYGMASAIGKADIDEAAAKYLANSQGGNIQASRAIYNAHPEYPLTQALFGVWSMAAWQDKPENFNARFRVGKYLYSRHTQYTSDRAYWWYDHGSGWLVENPAATATAVEGLAALLRDAQKFGRDNFVEYSNVIRANVPFPTDIDGGPDGKLYIARYDNEIDSYDPATNTLAKYGVSTGGTHAVGLVVGPDGSVYVAPRAASGKPFVLEKVSPQGSEIVLTLPEELESFDFLPDGRLAMLSCNNRRLYIADLATQTITKIVDVGLLPTQPRAVTALADGNMLVMGSYNSGPLYSVRVTPAGQQTRVYTGIHYTMTDVTQAADGTLIGGGGDAIYALSANGLVERFPGQTDAHKVAFAGGHLFGITRDGQSTGTGRVREFIRNETPIASDLEAMRKSLEDSARHFVTYPDYGTPAQAFRLIMLSEARPYVLDAALAAQIDARIPQLATQLRAAQRPDGGWARSGTISDPLTTSIVGTALDYTNPLPTDPVLRKTVQYLLAKQGSDGSWSGQYFDTRLGATSYVMAYLPRAVARLGGIDVGLQLDFGSDVKLVGSSVAPSSSTINADGSSSYFFGLGRISGGGAVFHFSLDMIGMKIDEWRKIATNAFLRFINSFTGETVEAPIDVPMVHAVNQYQLSLALNNNEFYAHDTVLVQPTVRNNGSTFTSGSLRYFIETTEGAPVAELPTVAFSDMGIGTQRTLPQPWDTDTHPAGDYRARVVLLSPEGQVWGEAVQPFRILTTSTGAQLTSTVATDQPVYDAFDTVSILGKVRNLTVNSEFSALTVDETVTGPVDEAVYATNWSIEVLPAATTSAKTLPFNLAGAAMGRYTVTQVVHAADGTVLDTQVTHFDVRASTDSGSGLTGTVAAVPPTVEQGEATSVVATVRNAGNTAFAGLPTVLSVIDPASETVLASWSQPVDLAVGQSASYSRPWNTAGVAPGAYQVVLQAQLPSGLKTLAYGPVNVIEPPVKVALSQSLGSTGRVLVLMTCRIGTGSLEDVLCTADRAAFVDALLTRLGISHKVVTTTAAFGREYATGRYDTYWISGGAQKLANTLAEEVREAVFQGDGLIVDGNHDSRNEILDSALGVKFTGQLSGNQHVVRMAAGEFDVGSFAASGDALTYVPQGAAIQGRFDSATGSPAFLAFHYGEGRSTVAAYDWIAALRNPALASQTETLLLRALHHVLPPAPTYGLAGGYLSVRTDVINQAKAADLLLRSVATAPLKLEDATPNADPLTALEARWRFLVGVGETRSFRLGLRLPASSGEYHLSTSVALASNASVPLAQQELSITVAASRELSIALRDELRALVLVDANERNARSRVIELLDSALAAQASRDRDGAIGYLLKAVDELAKIRSVPTAQYHVQLSVLIKAARVAPLP